MSDFPKTQYAVQLVGPSELKLNTEKEVTEPVGSQILCKVEATGLCFSDLKLLKQFTDHARKGPVVSGISQEALAKIPSYVPNEKPGVPGHEAVVRVVAVGPDVKEHKVGERCLVQSDYRAIKTKGSNAAFGYNFEGALQEYVIVDENVSKDEGTGERLLIPVGEEKSRSAIGLVEPWACVEDSYQTIERQTIKPGGKLLVVADADREVKGIAEAFAPEGKPTSVASSVPDEQQKAAVLALDIPVEEVTDLAGLEDASFDDIIYFGSDKATIEALSPKLANNAIMNVVRGPNAIGGQPAIGVGRIHYGMTRWIGTTESTADVAYKMIPPNGELRDGDNCLVIGAGGPMGQMHVIRNVCSGKKDLRVVGTDFDDPRLASLREMAQPFADANNVDMLIANPQNNPLDEKFGYVALMVPVPALVNQSIADSKPHAIVNIFAGIPAPTVSETDLDAIIEKQVFLFGTSGSVLRDMKIVLDKVESDQLDTDVSVDAVSGMAGAIDGIKAVEDRTMAGKIMVYPELHNLALTPLTELEKVFPSVAAKLDNGKWTLEAEKELLSVAD